jgi:hypothetical protein
LTGLDLFHNAFQGDMDPAFVSRFRCSCQHKPVSLFEKDLRLGELSNANLGTGEILEDTERNACFSRRLAQTFKGCPVGLRGSMEKFNLATRIPAASMARRVSGWSQAGPMVQTILVRDMAVDKALDFQAILAILTHRIPFCQNVKIAKFGRLATDFSRSGPWAIGFFHLRYPFNPRLTVWHRGDS